MQRWSAHVHARPGLVSSLAAVLFLVGSACQVSRSLGSDPREVIVLHDAGEVLDGSLSGSGNRGTDPGGVGVGTPSHGFDGSLPGAAAACSGRLTSQLFRRALCSCRNVALGSGTVVIDAFDSSEGPYNSSGRPDINAAVGVNGMLETTGSLKVSGDLTVTSLDRLTLSGLTTVLGDLRVSGLLRCTGAGNVDGDAWLEGGYQVPGTLNIKGDRIVPPAPDITASGNVAVGGSDRREPIAIEPPCACNDADVPDFTTALLRARTDNDNAAHGFDPARLSDVRTQDVVSLAGRVYSTGLHVSGASTKLTLMVDDKVSLFIDGDLIVEGGLRVELSAAGELDLFVAGQVALSGWSRVGNVEQPARVRVYVASEDPIRISGAVGLGANLYAARASVVLEGTNALYGSVFAQDFSTNNATFIHYDVRSGDTCAPVEP